MSTPVRYELSLQERSAHLLRVHCVIAAPDAKGQELVLPAWTPGSYLIRDHARHLLSIRARSAGVDVSVVKLDKQRWRCAPCASELTVEYVLYAFDESVRAAYLDGERAFIGGAAVFLRAEGQQSQPHALALLDVPRDWQVATTLPALEQGYVAADYAELIDHPLLCGTLQRIPFMAAGIPHVLVLDGAPTVDAPRLTRDLSRICEVQHALFAGGADSKPLFPQYQFLTRVVARGYGGLEHRSSTALICGRAELPTPNSGQGVSTAYRGFLGLCSHEYFHLWNVKRIRPEIFAANDLTQEAYTRDLWAYEGVTSYYDDLMLLRAGVIEAPEYLDLVAQTATRLSRTPGRQEQSLADSSFDAWIKFYRSDENTPNSQVSYYNKGALVALLLDLHLRLHGSCTLDKVMQQLWRDYGSVGVPVPEGGLERAATRLSGLVLTEFFERHVRGVGELPLAEMLAALGVEAKQRAPYSEQDGGGRSSGLAGLKADLGLRTQSREGRLTVAHVLTGSAAQAAGIHPGDELIACDGLRLDAAAWSARQAALLPGDMLELTLFRQERLRQFHLTAQAREADTWTLTLMAAPAPEVYARRRAWLGV